MTGAAPLVNAPGGNVPLRTRFSFSRDPSLLDDRPSCSRLKNSMAEENGHSNYGGRRDGSSTPICGHFGFTKSARLNV